MKLYLHRLRAPHRGTDRSVGAEVYEVQPVRVSRAPNVQVAAGSRVTFELSTEVTDIDFAFDGDRQRATGIHWIKDGV